MPGGGTRTFLEPDHYEASLRQAQIEAVIVPRGEFSARLTWAELHHLQVLRCEEDSPRLAYVQLTPELAFVSFPAGSEPLPVWRGREMQAGDIMFHSRVERLQRVNAEPFRLERDSHGPERYGWVLSRTPSLCHRRGELCSLPRVLRLACDACTRKPVALPRQSPRSCRIPRSRGPLNRV